MVWLCGMHFALRSGAEHRSLNISQLEIIQQTNQQPCLVYIENFSKNNAGGLAHRKVQPKKVVHHCNLGNPNRCLVRLYQIYLQHCPKPRKTDAFYLTPLKKPKNDVWFTTVPVGHNPLSQTVKRLCEAAGIQGFKTNHSLRVTSATRLFQSGLDEQLIMSRTGHRSVEGVRAYKRVNSEQKQNLSDVLNTATNGSTASKKPKLEETNFTSVQPIDAPVSNVSTSLTLPTTSIASSSTQNVSTSFLPGLNITGCTSVTINFNANNKDK